ncbi:hypothetical protein E4U53_006707 [Claviceps sorghi]|nr:hypothetical protein E4U53_006707 [Claviceps sorghi]
MSAPRIISKKACLFFVVLLTFAGSMLLSAKNMGQFCEDGSYCATSGLRKKLPNLAKDVQAGPKPIAADPIAKYGSNIPPAFKPVALDECAHFPNTSNILTIMKTGASESYSKIPIQLLTTLKCLPDHFIYSDMKDTIGGFTLRDSLETVLDKVKQTNEDFKLYHRQKSCLAAVQDCNKFFDTGKQGWTLDKYKNIHMAEKVYKMRPNYDWYFFIDADTYVVYANLVEWLKNLDPQKPHYIGSVAYLGQLPFGHGGSGYLVSQATMRDMFHGKENVANKFDEKVQHVCCGDAMFAQALKDEIGIDVVNAWPIINGEKHYTVHYGDDQWCHPISTMHHVNEQEMSSLYAFAKERNFTYPLRFKDFFHKFIGPNLAASRTDWDNLSDHVWYLNASMAQYAEHELKRAKMDGLSEQEAVAWRSFDDCQKTCLSQDDCFQFRYYNHICTISHRLIYGWPTKQENDDSLRYMSGWNMEKIKKWIKEKGECEEKFKWPIRDN